jgi:hypothetical protein
MDIEKGFSFRKFLAKVAFFCFGLSLVIHLTACFGINLGKYLPFIGLLHLGLFFVCIPAAISVFLEKENAKEEGVLYNWITSIPKKARYIAIIFFVYTILSFILLFAQNYEGVPGEANGKYVLFSNGRISSRYVIREITEAEYDLRQLRDIRSLSALWVIIYLVPALHFWYFRSSEKA